jgi:hypothetical protein
MKTTIDIPENELRDAMRFTRATTKREAVVKVLEEFNRRRRMAELVKYSGTFSDRFPTNDEIEAGDAPRERDVKARPRRLADRGRASGVTVPLADLVIFDRAFGRASRPTAGRPPNSDNASGVRIALCAGTSRRGARDAHLDPAAAGHLFPGVAGRLSALPRRARGNAAGRIH